MLTKFEQARAIHQSGLNQFQWLLYRGVVVRFEKTAHRRIFVR